jgi:predicted DNA-binding transcriptional regulator YafY
MRRAERLFRLVNEMRARTLCRAEDLAAQLKVSIRTVYRDIAHLQGSGLPIDGAPGVGYMLRRGFDLPNVTFTHDQVAALAIGLSFVEGRGDPVLAAAAMEVRAKLQASMPQPEARVLANAPYLTVPHHSARPHQANTLREAIRTRRVVALTYADSAGHHSTRHVQPLAIWTMREGWMFSGWCRLRQDFRTFRFDRIATLDLMEDRFADDPSRNLQAFLAQEHCEGQETPTTAPALV